MDAGPTSPEDASLHAKSSRRMVVDRPARRQTRERFRTALAALPDAQREAFLLREETGLALADIAMVTGVSGETAKSRLRYAVRKLKILLADD